MGISSNAPARALVTDVQIRSAVAGLRALGRAGVPVVALGATRAAAGLWSRHVDARGAGPAAATDAESFVRAVAGLARAHGPLVVYPGFERALDAILEARQKLPAEALLPYPDNGSVQMLRSKEALEAVADAAGMRAPRSLEAGTVEQLREAEIPLPSVIKPVTSTGTLKSASVVSSRAELESLMLPLPDGERLLVQEVARGRLSALALVLDRDGRLCARFQQTASRTWPLEAGSSSVAVSVAPDERFAARSARMLADAGYWGLAQLQFIDTAEGPALIDVNPRFYGSLPLALAAGVNLPAVWHAVALGGGRPVPTPYRIGIAYHWLEGDVSAAAQGAPRRLLDTPRRPRVGAMWAADDPLPSGLLAIDAATVRLRRRLPRAGRPQS